MSVKTERIANLLVREISDILQNEVNDEDKDRNYIHRERSYGKYQRSFYLHDLDSDKVDAEFTNGVLKITVPKKDEATEKKYIEIK